MNAVEAFQKQQILALVKQMTFSEEEFNAFNEKIERKFAEGFWQAREVELQPELNHIYELYKRAIERHKINLMTQYDLGKNTIQQIEEVEDLLKIMDILQAFETAIKPFLEEHKRFAMEIKDCEERIQLSLYQ